MSETEKLLKVLFNEMQEIKTNMATKQDLESMATKQDLESMATKQDLEYMATKIDSMSVKLDKLSKTIDSNHLENVNSDNLLLHEIRSLREGVVFVNRKVADAELEIHSLKQNRQ